MKYIYLRSSDNQLFRAKPKVAQKSAILREIIEDLDLENDGGNWVIPINQISGDDLKLVLQWARHHHEAHPEDSNYDHENISQYLNIDDWEPVRICAIDAELLKMSPDKLIQIMFASCHLDIWQLFEEVSITLLDMGLKEEEVLHQIDLKELELDGVWVEKEQSIEEE